MVKDIYRRRSVGPCGMYGELKALIPLSLLSGDDPDLAPLTPSPGGFLTGFLHNAFKSNSTGSGFDSEGRPLRPLSRLREPRDGLLVPPDCPQQGPRWPSECQVLDERVFHISVSPAAPEPFYVRTGREIQPRPVGEDVGQIVFQYYPISAVNYFSRSSVGGSRILLPACPSDLRAEDLRFESRFESGNLAKVVRITETYYELYLRTDMYTNRHMQWFYFRVANTRRHINYRFSIVNLSKGESLYSVGMRPLLYSVKDAQRNLGWRRCGDNIAYYKNDNGVSHDRRSSMDEDQNISFTLSFNIEFPHDNDTVYLAHCYPYTYSDLQDYLMRLQNHPVKSTFSKLRLLCRSLAGNNVYYLTITTPPSSSQGTSGAVPDPGSPNTNAQNVSGVPSGSCLNEEPRKKRAVVLTARVHPGETPSSWMMKGFMDFLTGDSNQAKELRDKFIFKLVPMLNPDGVIVGNNRCSLTGRDLNRQYRTVIRETYPPVWHTKLMIRRLMDECGVAMYCDLHAHSRKQNVFIYGCENKRNADKRLQEQVFPLMLHKNAADKFSFETCKFRIQRSKEGTGRVVVWMMGVSNSYTMEASFAGSTLGSRSCTHFSAQDYENMGRAFCETLLDFCDEDPSKLTQDRWNFHNKSVFPCCVAAQLWVIPTTQERLRNKIVNRLVKGGSNADEPTNILLSDYSSDEGELSSTSEEEIIQPTAVSSNSYHMCSRATVLNSAITRSRRKEKTAKPRCQCPLERSPPIPRKILQVATATIDMPKADIGRNRDADVGSTSPERESGNESSPGRQPARNKTRNVSPGSRIGDKIDMPPELIVTPAHHRKGTKTSKKSELEVPINNIERTSPYPMSASPNYNKSWHATRHRRKRYAKSHRQKGMLRPQVDTGDANADSCATCEVCLECSVRLSNMCSTSDDKVQEKQQVYRCTCRNISAVCQDPTGLSQSDVYECERSTATSTVTRVLEGKRKKRNNIGEIRRAHRRSASMIPSHTSTSLDDTETTDSIHIQWRRGKPRLRRQLGEEVVDHQESMTRLRVELQSNKHSKKQSDDPHPGNLYERSNPEKSRKARTRKSLHAKDAASECTTLRSSTESRSRETGLLSSQLGDYEYSARPTTTRKKKRKSHLANQL